MNDMVAQYRHLMLESLADCDEQLMDDYVHEREPSAETSAGPSAPARSAAAFSRCCWARP